MYVCIYIYTYGKSARGRVVHVHILPDTHITTHEGNWDVTHWTLAERTCVDVSSSMLAIARSKVLTLLALLVQKYKFILTPEARSKALYGAYEEAEAVEAVSRQASR